jgi:hypothetical protein
MSSDCRSSSIRAASVAEEDQPAQGRDIVVEQISVAGEAYSVEIFFIFAYDENDSAKRCSQIVFFIVKINS